jgi:choline-sulfatase
MIDGSYAPVLMVLSGSRKMVHCRTDPAMVFDLDADPLQLTNRADDTSWAEAVAATVAERWDAAALDLAIRASQRRRLFVQEAMKHGRFPSWDYGPPRDTARQYVRGGVDPGRRRSPLSGVPI